MANPPRTILGIEIAALARRFVPNCSADMVIYKTEKPEPKPNPAQSQYILSALPFICRKYKMVNKPCMQKKIYKAFLRLFKILLNIPAARSPKHNAKY